MPEAGLAALFAPKAPNPPNAGAGLFSVDGTEEFVSAPPPKKALPVAVKAVAGAVPELVPEPNEPNGLVPVVFPVPVLLPLAPNKGAPVEPAGFAAPKMLVPDPPPKADGVAVGVVDGTLPPARNAPPPPNAFGAGPDVLELGVTF